ncbi:hypothetical protein [Mycolicibacterium austroafricanum]|uniref:hypothetical protein n=1 Tax=Mycolicibacterium austroafricanum TaxID=39687 RepID=UPI000CF8B4B7|nr:hypothetical protein [Mycolicibacterium austroafricanum]PQP45804.1 hypothetical protein C6A88_19210 [Mycolicibacterium austroafricanum]
MFRFAENAGCQIPARYKRSAETARIIDALARLPIVEYAGCRVTVGIQIIRVDRARESAW